MDEGPDCVQHQLQFDAGAEVPALVWRVEGALDGRARRVEERGHERRPQRGVAGAVGKQRADHPRRHAFERGYEDLETLVEVAGGCNRCRVRPARRVARRAPRARGARGSATDGRWPAGMFQPAGRPLRTSSRGTPARPSSSSVAPSTAAPIAGSRGRPTPRPGLEEARAALVRLMLGVARGEVGRSAGAGALRQAWQRRRDHGRGQDPGRHNEGRRGDGAVRRVATRRASPLSPLVPAFAATRMRPAQTDGRARLASRLRRRPEGDALLAVGYPGARGDEHRREHDPVTEAGARRARGSRATYEASGEIPRLSPAAPTAPMASAARRVVPDAQARRHPSAECRAEQHESRGQQEPDAGLQGVIPGARLESRGSGSRGSTRTLR